MKMRYFLPGILFLALIAFIIVLLNMQVFNIKKITFYGNEKYTAEDLLKQTSLKTNENGFRQLFEQGGKVYLLRFTKEEDHLKKAFSYINDITVTYKLPDTVEIAIEERKSIFYTPYLGIYLLLDQKGTVLETTNIRPDGLILLSGISFTTFNIGETLDLEHAEKLVSAYEIYNAVKNRDEKGTYARGFLSCILELGFADKKNLHILLAGNIVAVIPVDGNLSYQTDSLIDIYFNNIQARGNGILDMTGINPVFTPYRQGVIQPPANVDDSGKDQEKG